MDVLTTAINWVYELGIGVFPLIPRDKRPAGWLLPIGEDGEHHWEFYKTRLPEPDELIRWFGCDGLTKPNLAVVTGWQGLTVLDFDRHKQHQIDIDYYSLWKAAFSPPDTFEVATSRGGRHVYYFLDNPPARKIAGVDWGDLQAAGAYVVGPGSVHPEGMIYTGNNMPIARVGSMEDLAESSFWELRIFAENSHQASAPAARVQAANIQPASATRFASFDNPWQAASNPPGDPIDQVKQRYRIEDFVTGVRDSGNGYHLALCPLHDDQNPSLSIYWDAKGQWCTCFAGCNRGQRMDVINLYARLHNLDDRAAIRELWDKIR